MIHYKLIKVTITINAIGFRKIIISIISYYGLHNLIITDKNLLFIFNFWPSLYHFQDVKIGSLLKQYY